MIGPAPASMARVHASALAFTAVFATLLYAAVAHLFLRHNDLGWHLAAGDLIRSQSGVPTRDPWSFTAGDTPWLNLSWGWDVLASVLYELAGFAPLVSMALLLSVAVVVLSLHLSLRTGAAVLPAMFGSLWVGGALAVYSLPLDVVLAAAPQTVSLPLFLAFLTLCVRADERGGDWRSLLPLPVLMLAWANLHGGFLLGFVVLGAFAAQAAYRRQWRCMLSYAAALAVCAGAMCINPLGPGIMAATLHALGSASRISITEWQPFAFGNDVASSAYLLAFILLAEWKTPRVTSAYKLLVLLFLVEGLLYQRHFAYFMVSSLPVLLAGVDRRLNGASRLAARYRALEAQIAADWCRPAYAQAGYGMLAFLLAAACVPQVVAWRFPHGLSLPADLDPREEIAFVAERFPGKPVYNHWNLGSFIIFHMRGETKVLVDGRAETAYASEFLMDYLTYGHEQKLTEQYDLRVALMPRRLPAHLVFFENNPAWKRVFSGPVANVYIRLR